MRNTRLLIVGVNGLSNEVAKNLVLAGIGSLTVMDDELVQASDLGAQFFLRSTDVGVNVTSANAFMEIESQGSCVAYSGTQSRRFRQFNHKRHVSLYS